MPVAANELRLSRVAFEPPRSNADRRIAAISMLLARLFVSGGALRYNESAKNQAQ
jgi:hypothetical protein